jgi:hypothetical protein
MIQKGMLPDGQLPSGKSFLPQGSCWALEVRGVFGILKENARGMGLIRRGGAPLQGRRCSSLLAIERCQFLIISEYCDVSWFGFELFIDSNGKV